MKKQLLLQTFLLATVSTFSQSNFAKPKPTGMIDMKTIAISKYGAQESMSSTKAAIPIKQLPSQRPTSTSNVINTWQNFTSSMNIYGVSNSYVKPLQWNDELNAVSFIHRKSPSYVSSPAAASNAENGTMVAMISTDCGLSWDSTAIWVNDNFWGRFPGGAIYNPPSNPVNTNIDNTYIVGAGPTTGAGNVTWIGNWYASKKIGAGNYNNIPSTVANAQQLAVTAGPFLPNVARHDFSAYNFTATDDGKMRVLAGITNDALTPLSDTAIMLITGTYNNGVFDWVGQPFLMPVTKSNTGAFNFVSRPMMAWNEAGTVGYIVVMGSRIGSTGSNVGYQPIVYKTINSGQAWSLENTIVDFNTPAYSDVKRSLSTVNTDTTLEVPNFFWGEGMDCSVDANNKLHIFTSILGHASNHPDSLNFISQFGTERHLWPHTPGFRPYLYDFVYDGTNTVPNWSHITIDSMSTEGPGFLTTDAGYDDNPWDPNPSESNRKLSVDARLQMSRTPDGQYMVYTWAESDIAFTTDQKKWNNLPNIKARLLNVGTNSLSIVKLDVTVDAIGEVANRAMCHFISPKCKLISSFTSEPVIGNVISVPMTVSNSNPYSQLTPNTHWYSCATLGFTVSTVGLSENALNSTKASYIYPNPAKNYATLNIDLVKHSEVQVEVLNVVGQIVKTNKVDGRTGVNEISIDLSGLTSGVYFAKVKVENASNTKKLVIE